jgi:hypothetical protein
LRSTQNMQGFISVPFKTESAHGLKQVNGLAKFSAAGVVLEFEAKLFGVIGGGVKEVQLAKSDILDIKFRKGLLKRFAKIEIRTTTYSKLAELPHSDGKLTLKITPIDFDRAREAVAHLDSSEMPPVDRLNPPERVPVSSLFDGSEDDTNKLKGADWR